ncbi:MAG: hypothetical protein K8R28_09420 [Desulfobacterales bacterium]|nr:hypothetical protein [Desulfobacterales bacterium]
MQESIDIFNIHQKIMDDYKHFVGSFINIRDEEIKEVVENKIDQGKLCKIRKKIIYCQVLTTFINNFQ